jgi:hypothetical protein
VPPKSTATSAKLTTVTGGSVGGGVSAASAGEGNRLRVQDIDSAASWYQTVFGLEQVKLLEVEDGAYSIRLLSKPASTWRTSRLSVAD